jgi:EAL domain-containing protein (putative c-di-GMP-specific phosphodiesterase class I)/CheY-like chemotaxis protein
MDLMMPDVDGLEATRVLKNRQETARVPILMLTALDDTEDRIQAFEAGATGFLNKPFDRLELLAHVRSYVNLSLINRKYVLSTANLNTGLPNRAAYRDEVQRYSRPWLFLVGMDGIDSIRQFYGESRARAMEREYAEYLERILDEDEYGDQCRLFHFGSGLFGILYDDAEREMSREKALERSRWLHENLNTYEVSKEEVQWESDFTIVVSSEGEELLEQAELGMQEALRNRRNVVFASDVAERVYSTMENNLRWLGLIRQALVQHRFVAYYQPIVDNRTGEIYKYEALLRMLDENGQPVSPGQFLLVAKNSKYYGDITRIVFERVIRDFKNRSDGVSVNLSVLDIESRQTRHHILSTLRYHPDVARRLTLEIVEQEGLKHYDQVKSFIQEVKALGATIALDDFGSGYSNFVRIIDLEVDYVKIDGSIITRICSDEGMLNLVQGIKSFVSANNIKLVAEFVESEDIMRQLSDVGVEYSQGFYFGRPEPSPEDRTEVPVS